MGKLVRAAVVIAFFLGANAFASGGACPSGVPVTGNNCYFVAANGSDSNSGTSESSPWAHAPGMPKCAGNCAAVTPAAGEGFIFKGGDTWHFGNSSATPYTGGTWSLASWSGTSATCVFPSGTQTGCIYFGVDKTWYSGASWSRPILNGDNPPSTSTVGNCAHAIGARNDMISTSASYLILDNFNMTGMCVAPTSGTSIYGLNHYIDTGSHNMFEHNYIHGWSSPAPTTDGTCENSPYPPAGDVCFGMYAVWGSGSAQTFTQYNICDGSDSYAPMGACFDANMYYMAYNYFTHNAQTLGGGMHDIHDNVLEYWVGTKTGAHGNMLETLSDVNGATPNVFYNNVIRHDASGGDVKVWICPPTSGTTAEYWFNNVMTDVSSGNVWNVGGGSCGTPAGSQYMFNNTFELGTESGALTCKSTTTVANNHIIEDGSGSPWSSTACTGYNSPTNVVMNHTTSDSQGYTSSGGVNYSGGSTTTCATEGAPCAPTAGTNSTVGAGSDLSSYCTALSTAAASDPALSDAATACATATTDACSYNTTTHSLSCPANPAVARPTTWDSGAYQYSGQSTQQPAAPTNLSATVH